MKTLIAKKIGMTQIYDENSKSLGVTVLDVSDCRVVQVKNNEKDGYSAVQLGYGNKKEKHANKAQMGHFKKANLSPLKKVFEFDDFSNDIKLGDKIGVDIFKEGEFVDVVGVSKGKGFQGVVKRYGFKGVGDKTHGQHNRERAPGSIGASSYPSRVFKGMRMGGHMGNERKTTQNLKVIKIDIENNLLVVKGAVPGHNNSIVLIKK